ncbi:LPS-assembly protein LptD [Azomonas macrocytogenes]|uniref:LPS-assembly protein LptD n=1 Tax=Azomonas macrocytogenes TaxID=69962 RepID=A0A839T2A8_AZOMA|nr:LPS-assembly protein LptD [Azomonas macrocytogenes]MBB3102085.1 LPS-assembly protein [Azomonas macrocytogenes]
MAVKHPLFRKKFPLLVTGSLLALQPMATSLVLAAAEEYTCKAGSGGGWACTTGARPKQMAPRPSDPTASGGDGLYGSDITQVSDAGGKALKSRSEDYSHLDWVPREKLTAAQMAELSPYCTGTYVEPDRPGRFDKTPKSEAPIYVSAKASRHEQDTEDSVLAGNVVLRQGSMQVEADEARLHRLENTGELSGNVRLRDNDTLMVGDRAELQLDNGEAQVENLEYVLHSSRTRGNAQYAKREETSILRLKDGTYTSCEPGSNEWYIQANNIVIDPTEGYGHGTNVTVRVHEIPVFYTPYLSFPIDDRRKSGFLMPSFGSSSNSGMTLLTPYYFNLAPNFDATLFPSYMAKRGPMMEGEFRYLTQSSEGQVGGGILSDKDDKREDQSLYKKTRWMYSWQHRTGLDSRWMAEVDYTDISDPYYFRDLQTNLQVNYADQLNQRATLTYRGDSFTARANMHAFERATISDITPYDRLPQLSLNGTLPFQPGGLSLSYDTEFVKFERNLRSGDFINENGNSQQWYDEQLRGLARADGDRLHLEPSISLPLNWTWGYLKPTIKYAYTSYDIDLDKQGKNTIWDFEKYKKSPSRSLPMVSIDSGLYFDRQTQLFSENYRQTLEPRLYYLYVPKENQDDIPIFDTGEYTFNYSSLWRDNRFSGHDRIADANQISLGVTSRWIDDNGLERQTFSIGQTYFFRDRKVELPGIDYKRRDRDTATVSPVAAEYMYRHNSDWRFTSDLNWDIENSQILSSSAIFHYQPVDNINKIVNLGFRYRTETMRFNQSTGRWEYNDDFGEKWITDASGNRARNPNYIKDYYKIEQTDFSTIWPLAPHWNVIARLQYDLNRDRVLDAYGGFEYDSCCWKLRVVNRYWINYRDYSLNPDSNDKGNTGIFFQVTLKGLGNAIGAQTDKFLDQTIEGYRTREDQAR